MNNPAFVRTVLAIAIPLAAVASIVLAVGYVQDQQILRQSANEPQVQLSESIAAQIDAGVPPQAIVQGGATPLELMQTPFILIYDGSGKIIGGNTSLNGQAPVLPAGVLGAGKGIGPAGENRITWQPKNDLREALVVAPYTQASSTGYVVVGRSLRETENEEHALTLRAVFGWVGTMAAVVIFSLIGAWLLGRRKPAA